MQLVRLFFASILLLIVSPVFAQEPIPTDTGKIKLDPIDISFQGSYYEQDGVHSPVTGGSGTEKLDNRAPSIIVTVPIDTVRTISVSAGVDYYTSASSDNINNPFLLTDHVSGASADDKRLHGTVNYKKKDNQKNNIKGFFLGFSHEWDVNSFQIGGSFAKSSADHNREINLSAKYFFDDWKLIYPVELRNGDQALLPTDKRHTLTLSATGSSVINKRMNASVSADIVLQKGSLSTPFHRVYFVDEEHPRVEMLPDFRVKFPMGFRYNFHFSDFMLFKAFMRVYYDTWGMTGATVNVELPIKIGKSIRLYPFYRMHGQTKVNYFNTWGQHHTSQTYYTSDYDLSTLSSQKYGAGLSIAPLYGIIRIKGKHRLTMFKSLDFRYAIYSRSDGFTADVFSLGLKFSVARI